LINHPSYQHPGFVAEKIAYEYLINHGLIGLYQNFRSKFGEIDLIMMQDEMLVFIEVRHRSDTRHMDPLETITTSKVRKIILTSQYFLQKHQSIRNQFRFDIITMTGNLNSPQIKWIKNAFDG
jgi:putative endonuclease